jgi:probable 2-oxoglutarate dehydrogenase E1 component DHKTD1
MTFILQFRSIPDTYCDNLINKGVLKDSVLKQHLSSHDKLLNDHLNQLETYVPQPSYLQKQWNGLIQAQEEITTWDTGVDIPLLQYIGVKSVQYPNDFVRKAMQINVILIIYFS